MKISSSFLLLIIALIQPYWSFSLRLSRSLTVTSKVFQNKAWENTILFEKPSEDIEETTKKFGFEFGLWKSFTSKNANIKPQDLLKKYGIAYLATSVTFAVISYTLCYLLVSNGVDVASLLEKIGIKANEVASNAGTAGIAYAIHKAASPIRFPPTVALTPIVAEWLGKKPNEAESEIGQNSESA
jgi:hypothetical protein